MKLVCNKDSLKNGVQTVLKAVPKRSTMSILQCILVDATKGEITLTANDMELCIHTVVEGTIEQKGRIALDAQMFSAMLSKVKDEEVTLESDENFTTNIISRNLNYTLDGKSGEDFPYLPDIDKTDSILISQMAFRDLINNTIFSIAETADDSPSQQTMRGELLEIFGDSMRMSSLDGHRISICRMQLKDVYDAKKVIVPGKSLGEVSRILTGGAEEDVEISFTQNHIMFEFDKTTVVSRLIEGKFFDVDKMNIKDYETKFKANRRDFMDCIDCCMPLVKEGDKKPIIFDIKDNTVIFNMKSSRGNMVQSLDVEKTGKDMMIAFNPKFMLEALRAIDEDDVELYFMNSKAPCHIKNNTESYVYVILPINFSNV